MEIFESENKTRGSIFEVIEVLCNYIKKNISEFESYFDEEWIFYERD